MAPRNPPLFAQDQSHPAEDIRRFIYALVGGTAGVAGTAALDVSERGGTANMSVDVASGGAFVAGTSATFQGIYFVENRGTENLALTAADPTLARIDVIVARVRDTEHGDASSAWALEVVTGTAAASPVAPAVPTTSVPLAEVSVGANVTAIVDGDITDTRVVVQVAADVATDLAAVTADVLANSSDIIDNAADITATETVANNAFTNADAAFNAASTANAGLSVAESDIDDLEQKTTALTRSGTSTEIADNVITFDAGSNLRLQSNQVQLGDGAATAIDVEMPNAGSTAIRFLDSNGNPGIGINSLGFAFLRPNTSAASTNLIRVAAGATNYGQVTVSSSSERFKERIQDLQASEAERIVKALRTISYHSKFDVEDGVDEGAGLQFGFSAENVYETEPEMASLDQDGKPAGVDDEAILAQLLCHVKALTARVEELEKK